MARRRHVAFLVAALACATATLTAQKIKYERLNWATLARMANRDHKLQSSPNEILSAQRLSSARAACGASAAAMGWAAQARRVIRQRSRRHQLVLCPAR